MKLLAIHSDYIEYEVTSKTKLAEEISKDLEKGRMDEVLACFITVEKIDEKNKDIANQALSEIQDIAEKVKAKNIMLYPYAHLSPNLASKEKAVEILKNLEERLKEEGFNVKRSPFGYYKAFKISCKGHPLSELSRSIEGPEEEKVSEALKAEEKIKSFWYILTPEGNLVDTKDFDFSKHENLKKFVDYEISKVRSVDVVPPHVKLMQRMELVDYEEGSDAGNFRWYPKGTLIKRLLEEKIVHEVVDYGAMEVETPIMYDAEHPQLEKYLNRFPARQYILLSGEKEYFLRFAACFGQYLMKHDMTISYRNLPLKLFELTHYSFRREQRGELVGLRRLRTFTMPDMHTLVRDIDEAKREFKKQFELSMKWMREVELDYEVGIRFVREFFEENRDFAQEIVRMVKKPVLIEMWDERPFYFVMKFEFNIVDSLGKASALSTVQIDVENTKRFGITYVDEKGKEVNPPMLHASISGSIDRNVYAILEKAAVDSSMGKKPCFPLWLAPTQLRFIPVSDEYVLKVLEVAKGIDGIRWDIDDRSESVSKKIRDAEREWVPYIVVFGEKEEKGVLSVRIRGEGQKKMKIQELISEIKKKTEKMPFKKIPLPILLSKRAKFR